MTTLELNSTAVDAREAPLLLSAFLDSSSNVFVGLDTRLRILHANANAQQLAAGLANRLRGQHFLEVLPESAAREFEMRIIFAQQSNSAVSFDLFQDAGAWFECNVSPQPWGFSIWASDITARKRSEAQLKTSEERHRSIIASMSEGVVLQDRGATILAANASAERILGLSLAELTGRKSADPRWRAIREDLSPFPGYDHPASVTLRTGEPQAGVIMGIEKPSGQRTWISVNSEPLRHDDEPEPYGVVATFTDITDRCEAESERKRLQAQLQQAQRLESIGRLAGGIAHDFNNLLTVVNGYASMLAGSLDDPEQQEHALSILKAGQRAERLTHQLLAFSRQQMLSPEPVNITSLVGDLLHMIERLIGDDVVIHRNLDDRVGVVIVDPGQIEQVLLNLTVNARDAMPSGGEIWLEAGNLTLTEQRSALFPDAPAGQYVFMRVRDTGHGMAPEAMPHVFEPFFTTKGLGKGSGLGLATVHGIVRQSSGFIRFESQRGVGTMFEIILPQVPASYN